VFEQVFVILRGRTTRHAIAFTISRATDSLEFLNCLPVLACTSRTGKDVPMSTELDLLPESTQRLVRTVDGLTDEQWGEPSALPGWTRGHVVAHVTLNAEGLAEVLRGVARGEAVPMYPSQEARDDGIAELAAADPAMVRERFLASGTRFLDAFGQVPDDMWSATVERVPGGRVFPASAVLGMRLREVEIHHVDLDAGYAQADWPPAFSALVIDAMTVRGAAQQPFVAHATDLDRSWSFGDGGPTVTGAAADLAWWLTGRGNGENLTSNDGVLPGIETW